MKTFKVYQHPVKGIETVKTGFSWPAFFFSFWWMGFKRLWPQMAMTIAAWLGAEALGIVAGVTRDSGAHGLLALLAFAAYCAICLVPGFLGNAWRERNLVSRGYELVRTSEAPSADAALAQFVKQTAPV
ncbi:MAG: DUF2628 domain-containing protein [Burkholderiaceae bacterium]|nr:DUF2628 domain-containing protein [Burkholderiaceae bacterium]